MFDVKNMNTDLDTCTFMANSPAAPTEIASRELIVVTAPGNPKSGGDVQVGAMEPSTGENEKTGRRKNISCECLKSFTIRCK